jgi:Bacterial membrane protein YfhO
VRQLARDRTAARLRSLAATSLTAVLLAAGLAAAQWWPSMAVLAGSSRAELPGSYRTYWSLHPASLPLALVPVLPRDLPLRRDVRERLFEGREPFINSLYLGLATIPLVLAALFGPRRRLAAALAASTLAAGAFALGRYGPVYGLAVALLPPLGVFRYPVKAVLVATFAWALLAGLGLDGWRASRRLGPVLAVVALVVGLGALRLGAQAPLMAGQFLASELGGVTLGEAGASVERALVIAGACALAAALLFLPKGEWPAAALVLVVASDLVLAARGLNPTAPREVMQRRPAVVDVLKADGASRVYSFDYQRPIPGKTYRRPSVRVPYLAPLLPLPPHLRQTLSSYGLLPTGTLSRFGLFGSYDWDLIGLSPGALRDLVVFFLAQEDTPGFRRLLELGSVSHVIALHREGLEDLEPVAALGTPFTEEAIRVYRVPHPLPRAYAVGGVRIARGGDARATLVDPGFEPRAEVVLAEGEPRATPAGFEADVGIVSYRPDRVRLRAELRAAGFVVLTDAYSPGWTATVDGRSVPVRRANEIFRAAEVPAGRHEVEFVYRPRAVTVGLLAGGAGLLGCAVLAALERRRASAIR